MDGSPQDAGHKIINDMQPEAGATLTPPRGEKRLHDPAQVLLRYSRTIILHDQLDPPLWQGPG